MDLVTSRGLTILVSSAAGLLMAYFGMRTWMAVLAAACIVGGAMGWVAVSAAIWFNRQEAFINEKTGAVNYLGLAEIFLSWFLVVSCVLCLAPMIVALAVRWLRILLVR